MSEPLAEHLSRFTPEATGLNRDALLFAAGRASVRANRKWKTLASALALSQVLTLLILWPQAPPLQTSTTLVVESPAHAPPLKESVLDPSPEGVWRAGMLSMDVDRPEPIPDEAIVPSSPPLRIFDPPPASILN
jgi:hypothetical protein